MKLVVIGEASARLSNEIRNRYLEVEWKAIIGFRNISVHAYFSVNWNIVWETATNDLEILREAVIKILENDFPDFELRNETK